MRKLILTLATGFLTISMFAQSTIQTTPHNRAQMMAKFKDAKSVPFKPSAVDNGSGVPVNTNTFYAKTGARTGTTIGSTGYPLQTNSGTYDRVRAYGDGSVSAVYTGSSVIDHVWNDRGSFYNHYDGTSWGPNPTSRIETERTGFPELLTVMDHEVIISHDNAATPYNNNIAVYKNSSIGGTTWSATAGSLMPNGLWNHSYCPAGTDDIYMVHATGGNPPTEISFSRSDDGGESWSILNYALPYLDAANCIGSVSADAYQIAVSGTTVYILYGTSWTNLVLLSSSSNGDAGSWTSQTLIETGLCDYSGALDEISDVNGDGIADTVETTDGFHEMVLDNSGVLHVWSGYYWLLDADPAEGWNYFPSIYGLWYWNSTMTVPIEGIAPNWIDLLIDWDNTDGLDLPFEGIGTDLGMYDGVTFTSMPVAAIDESINRIYLMYTMPIEYTDYFEDPTVEEAQSFRDIFGCYSDDMGLSWSEPVNMTYTANLNQESVFPNAYDRVVGGCVHTIWMQDEEPGTSLDTNLPDGDATNTIQYRCFDNDRFNPYPPTAEYEYFPDGVTGIVNFTNLSVDADNYSWTFGDGGTSASENPVHLYADSGPYLVCLTAYNHYEPDGVQECKTININVAIEDMLLNQALTIFPSPAVNYITVEVAGNFGNLYAEMYNALGEKVINTSSLTNSINFDVTSLASGNYIVKVFGDNGNYTTRQVSIAK